MARRSLTCVPDHVLLQALNSIVARHRSTTAEMLEHIAEVDARGLHLPAGHSSMYRYCVSELRMSEDSAYKRIRAARTAREFPAILDMVADGRLHLTAVVFLTPHLTCENAADLLAAAAHRTKAQLEQLLAERFPKSDVPTSLTPIGTPVTEHMNAAANSIASTAPAKDTAELTAEGTGKGIGMGLLVPEPPVPSNHVVPAPVQVPPPQRPRVAPLSPGRYELRTTLDQATHDQLRRLQELLSHSIPSGDIAAVLGRAFELAIRTLEKRRAAATDRPGAKRRTKSARHIPAQVRRAVCARDGDQCTFVSDNGRRCTEKRFLEFDHVWPVARGGEATVENTRLRCRAHNQYEAERVYGAGFMREKREAARARVEDARARRAPRPEALRTNAQ